ncbi:MAG: pyrroline-5-carboxylate reductase [Fibromonadaceae bacterium]|jgi:pyrroline-5-carboxylate reductase|nr:pyrroline-5-carboxylate reductase [Fibromonadaceae bacterium]
MLSSAKKIFFIGAGNMGAAISKALTENGYPVSSVFFYEPDSHVASIAAEKSKATRLATLAEGFSKADIVFLCIKPQIFSKISASLRKEMEAASKEMIVVSIMAGVTLLSLRTALKMKNIVRTMPNIAITVKKGTVAIASEEGIEESVLQTVEFLFSTCANTVRVLESQMDAVTGLSGSGPAFVFQFIEALVMGGVKVGLTRDAAMRLALSTVEGSIEMLKDSKLNPGELTANVCSPAGTTIAGVQELENKAFRGAVMAAVEAAVRRSTELGK